MLVAAESLNVVPFRFAPERLPALKSVTWVVPSGPIRTPLSPARFESVRLSVTLTVPTADEVPWPVIVSGELMLDDGPGIRIGGGTETATGAAPLWAGLIESDQPLSVAVRPVAALVTRSLQVPLTLWPINFARPVESFVKNVPV